MLIGSLLSLIKVQTDKFLFLQAFKSNFQPSNRQLFTNEILCTFVANQNARKAIDNVHVILNKIQPSFLCHVYGIFPLFIPSS